MPLLDERPGADDRPREDKIIVFDGVTWGDFQRLLEIRGDRSAPRFAFNKGLLEIMRPSESHELIKGLIGRLVETYCFEHDIEFRTVGSWTLEDKEADKAAEPDECYVFGDRPRGTRPDLAIDVVWTSGRIDKLRIYEALHVREVWIWRKGKLDPFVLGARGYKAAAKSKALPGIDLAELVSYLDRRSTSRAMLDYRAALRRKARKR